MKNFVFKTSLLSRVEGSCIYEEGPNKIVCAVIGPSEAKTKDEAFREAVLNVIIRKDVGVIGPKELQIEQMVWKTISPMIMRAMYPHSLIQIVIQIISSETSEYMIAPLLAAILNASCISLLDSGIAMKNTFCAVFLSVFSKDGKTSVILNPSSKILNDSTSTHVVCYAFPNKELLLCDSIGFFTENELTEIFLEASVACQDTHDKIKAVIMENII
ncbi:hypothetical protein PCK2_000390 [Pneumocystis canis]|nr:hypothetical protein PCK2_000390 [Pneumocystis canis]